MTWLLVLVVVRLSQQVKLEEEVLGGSLQRVFFVESDHYSYDNDLRFTCQTQGKNYNTADV